MAIGSGLASSVGIVAESTYGTAVTVTQWPEADSVNLEEERNRVTGEGLYAGKLLNRGARRTTTTKGGGGSVEMEMVDVKRGRWLQGLMGSTATPVLISGTSYTQTHTLADNVGKFYTIQTGVPLTTGTVVPYTFAGCKIVSAEFSCKAGEQLKGTFEVDARSVVDTTPSLAAPSYTATNRPFGFQDAAFKVGTFGAEAAIQGVKGWSLKIERGQATDRYYYNNAGLKSEPLINEATKVTMSIEFDYVDKTIFADRFSGDSTTSVVVEFVGPTAISGANFPTIRFTIPGCYFDSGTPMVEGEDIVNTTVEAVALFDGTNYPTITVISSEAAL